MLAWLVSVTLAVAESLGFASLVARTVTVAGDGSAFGAVYVVVLEPGPFVTVPKVEFPPTIPFTSQVTEVSCEPETCAVNDCVAPSAMVAVDGFTLTLIGPRMVTAMDADLAGSAAGVAVMATVFGDGGTAGA